jgi:hypothetical protein
LSLSDAQVLATLGPREVAGLTTDDLAAMSMSPTGKHTPPPIDVYRCTTSLSKRSSEGTLKIQAAGRKKKVTRSRAGIRRLG